MIPRSARAPRPWLAALASVLVLGILVPAGAVAAHASLVSSDPADGATLASSPASITATFAEAFDTARSSMELLRPDGTTLAKSAPGTSGTAESMAIAGFGTLVAGTYSVRWTTITPDDNGIERGTFGFAVATSTALPSPTVGSGATSGGAGDIVLPLVALVVLVGAGLAWFLRRSR